MPVSAFCYTAAVRPHQQPSKGCYAKTPSSSPIWGLLSVHSDPIPSARPDPTCKVVVASIVVLTETHRVDQTPGSCLAPGSGTHHFASYISVVGALLHHRFSTPRLIRRFHFEGYAFRFFRLRLVFEPRPRLPGTGAVATAGEARVWTPLNL